MEKCAKCGANMVQLFTSMACSAECDIAPAAEAEFDLDEAPTGRVSLGSGLSCGAPQLSSGRRGRMYGVAVDYKFVTLNQEQIANLRRAVEQGAADFRDWGKSKYMLAWAKHEVEAGRAVTFIAAGDTLRQWAEWLGVPTYAKREEVRDTAGALIGSFIDLTDEQLQAACNKAATLRASFYAHQQRSAPTEVPPAYKSYPIPRRELSSWQGLSAGALVYMYEPRQEVRWQRYPRQDSEWTLLGHMAKVDFEGSRVLVEVVPAVRVDRDRPSNDVAEEFCPEASFDLGDARLVLEEMATNCAAHSASRPAAVRYKALQTALALIERHICDDCDEHVNDCVCDDE